MLDAKWLTSIIFLPIIIFFGLKFTKSVYRFDLHLKGVLEHVVDLPCCVSLSEQHSDSVTQKHMFTPFEFFSRVDSYRILSRVPGAVQ